MTKLKFKYIIAEETENRFVSSGKQVIIEIDIGNKSPTDPVTVRNAQREADRRIRNREY